MDCQNPSPRLLAISLTVVLLATMAFAAGERVVYPFTGGFDGGDPASSLTFDASGNAYGTTVVGGDAGFGTVFKLTRDQNGNWSETVLYSFQAGDDGKNPYGGVILDRAGNLYGVTAAGGSGGLCTGDGCGTIFKLTRSGDTYTESVVYAFTGGNDGFGPGASLAQDRNGVMYGMTPDGGQFAAGTVFELIPSATGRYFFRTIYAFTGGDDGSTGSLGPLLVDSAGNLYGVTELGGANGVGTVFKMTPAGGGQFNFTTLYTFLGMPDAAFPYGGVILDQAGNLYGTTYFGGQNGVGAVYKLMPNGQESVLYSFQGGTDASFPTTTLVFDGSGNLWGTSSTGGDPNCDCGTVFELSPVNGQWQESIAHVFESVPDGANPNYGLTPDNAGNLYSTTATGGTNNQGTVFEIMPANRLLRYRTPR